MLALWYHLILATLFTVLALLLIGVILLQRGKGTGLSGAFGGAGGGTATFGSKTGDILTWITVGAATLLMLYAIVLNFLFRPLTTASDDSTCATSFATLPALRPTRRGLSTAGA